MNKIVLLALIVLLSFIVGLAYWWNSLVHQPPKGIILISLDTLRADHLGCYRYYRDTSPSIDAFAMESILFENAIVQAPNTLASHMSIMTSLYPSFHGVGRQSFPLDYEHKTIAELLNEEGYQTAGFTDGGYVSGVFGFHQGFETYNESGGGIENTLPQVKKWLDANKEKPFFLFIHSYDIHGPYNPPPPFVGMFHELPYMGTLVPTNLTLWLAYSKKIKLNEADLDHFIALYDEGIRYVDEKLGEFFSYLQDTDLREQSLVIITSDHGEEFNEHGSFLHHQLYFEPNLHVPLIIRIPSYPKKQIRIEEFVQSIDILPTILDIMELPAHPKAQGKSLLPLIKLQRNYFAQFLEKITSTFMKNLTIAFAEHEPHMPPYHRTIITNDGYQLITDQEFKTLKLFNLSIDPLTQNNILEGHNAISEQLLLNMKKQYNLQPDSVPTLIQLDEKTQQQLETLGYVDSTENIPDYESSSDIDDMLEAEKSRRKLLATYQEDTDGDGVRDVYDNCPDIINPKQEDIDKDKVGTACDTCIDTDWDGYGNPEYPNTCKEDNCPSIFNPRQEDGDGDGIGDPCDCKGDLDGDGDADGFDFLKLLEDMGRKNCSKKNQCNGDLDCDGDVDQKDFRIFEKYSGRTNCQEFDNQCSYTY